MEELGSESVQVEKSIEDSYMVQRFPQEFDYETSLEQLDPKKFNFYVIKTTESTESGFPILPSALSTSPQNSESNLHSKTPKCCIPLRPLTGNYEEVLSRSINAFLQRCFKYTDKRRRSSRICKHKPGVKHYCRRKNWEHVLAQYKSEVLDNPWVDLKTFYKENGDIPKMLMSYYDHSYRSRITEVHRHQTANIEEIESHSEENLPSKCLEIKPESPEKYCEIFTDSPFSKDNVYNESDDMSSFLRIFGLKKVVFQNEIENHSELFGEEAQNNSVKIEVVPPLDHASKGSNETTDIEDSKDQVIQLDQSTISGDETVCLVRDNTIDLNKNENESIFNNEVNEFQKAHEDNEVVELVEQANVSIHEVEKDDQLVKSPVDSSLNLSDQVSHDCCCHVQTPIPTSEVNEPIVQSSPQPNINQSSTDSLPKIGIWDQSSSPSSHSSTRNSETRFDANIYNHNPSPANVSAIPSFSGSYPLTPGSQPCFSRQMYTQSGGVSAMYSHFYGPPCIPGPIVASQLMPPVLAYNIFPMNNIMCASHPGIMPFQCNGSYVSTAFDCNSLHTPPPNSLPWTYHYNQSGPIAQYHKPWVHQWVNVNASAVAPCRVQANDLSRIHIPCCTELSQGPDNRSQPSVNTAYFPSSNRSNNIFLSHPNNTDIFIENSCLKFPQERK